MGPLGLRPQIAVSWSCWNHWKSAHRVLVCLAYLETAKQSTSARPLWLSYPAVHLQSRILFCILYWWLEVINWYSQAQRHSSTSMSESGCRKGSYSMTWKKRRTKGYVYWTTCSVPTNQRTENVHSAWCKKNCSQGDFFFQIGVLFLFSLTFWLCSCTNVCLCLLLFCGTFCTRFLKCVESECPSCGIGMLSSSLLAPVSPMEDNTVNTSFLFATEWEQKLRYLKLIWTQKVLMGTSTKITNGKKVHRYQLTIIIVLPQLSKAIISLSLMHLNECTKCNKFKIKQHCV